MHGDGPRRLRGLLTPGPGGLGELIEQAGRLARASERLRRRLGPPLGDHSRVAGFAAGTAVVQADSAAWASRLRFMTAEVIEALAPALGPVERVRVTVASPPPALPAGPRPARPVLGPEPARTLDLAAGSLDDPALAAALRRLARHGTRG
jgi:hypothetical protein